MDISIVVSTCDRSGSLSRLLNSVEHLTVPKELRWELLLVDNSSVDSTRELIASYMRRNAGRIKYIFEKKRGKSRALNKAVVQARGEILIFTDDDCLADPGWVSAILDEYAADPDLSVLGGRVELKDERDKAVTVVLQKDRDLFSPDRLFFYPLIIGCNMAFKKKVFEAIGLFDTGLGPGTVCSAALDSDIVYRAYKKGFKTAYSPAVVIYHNHGRRMKEEVEAVEYRYWIGRGAFYCKYMLKRDMTIAKLAYWDISSIVRALITRILSGESTSDPRRMLRGIIRGMASRMGYEAYGGLNG